MSYSCLEELQVDLDLYALGKINILSKVGCKCNEGWFVITDDGQCHLFDKDGNLDDIKKVKRLKNKHIRKDIKKIIIPDSITNIDAIAFYNCEKLTSIMIPDSVTSIGESAFDSCYSLKSVTIPDSVTRIGIGAFYLCHGLTSIMIGNGVISIKDWTFYNCNSLMNVIIGNSVKNIDFYAFSSCDKLANLIFKGKTLEQVKKMRDYPWEIEDESIINVK